jgi:ribosomal protein S18 acetylase RimI-like enzyme
MMDLTYFKRFRMEIDLAGRDLTPRLVPPNYYFLPWQESLLDAFSEAKYRSFRHELDANVFPCLSEFDGCRKLMAEIVRKPGFVPGATWLAVCSGDGRARPDYCGTVQGIRDRQGRGAIQNLGIVPAHRNLGLGTSLLWHALLGFRQTGVRRVSLEVTAQNDGAIRLYQRAGFVVMRTVYKAVETEYCT